MNLFTHLCLCLCLLVGKPAHRLLLIYSCIPKSWRSISLVTVQLALGSCIGYSSHIVVKEHAIITARDNGSQMYSVALWHSLSVNTQYEHLFVLQNAANSPWRRLQLLFEIPSHQKGGRGKKNTVRERIRGRWSTEKEMEREDEGL